MSPDTTPNPHSANRAASLFPTEITSRSYRRRRRVRRTVTAAVVVVLIGGGGLALAQTTGKSPSRYRTATASQQEVTSTLDGVATIQPIAQAEVAFPNAGTVACGRRRPRRHRDHRPAARRVEHRRAARDRPLEGGRAGQGPARPRRGARRQGRQLAHRRRIVRLVVRALPGRRRAGPRRAAGHPAVGRPERSGRRAAGGRLGATRRGRGHLRGVERTRLGDLGVLGDRRRPVEHRPERDLLGGRRLPDRAEQRRHQAGQGAQRAERPGRRVDGL